MGPFVTATEFCEWTGMRLPDDLARLQLLIASASSLIRGVTGQVLSRVEDDVIIVQPEYNTTTGRRNPPPRAFGEIIELPERPVTTISGILVDAVAFTEFAFNSDGIMWRTDTGYWDKAATITYDHGYAETSDEFHRIRTVCIEAVKRAYTFDESGGAIGRPATPIETIGFPIEVFLTEGEKQSLPGVTMAVG